MREDTVLNKDTAMKPFIIRHGHGDTSRRLTYLYQLLWDLITDVPEDCVPETIELCEKIEKLVDKIKRT